MTNKPLRTMFAAALALVAAAWSQGAVARAQTGETGLVRIDTLGGFTGQASAIGNSDFFSNFSGARSNFAGGYGISGDGNTVVGFSVSPSGFGRAFRLRAGGAIEELGSFDGQSSFAAAVSRDGSVVVGWSLLGGQWKAFRWTETGGMENLGTLDPGGRGFSGVFASNYDGSVLVGGAWTATTIDRAFRWTRETGMVNLGVLSGNGFSDAYGVSGDGNVVVGLSTDTSGQWRAFRWTETTGMVDIGRLNGVSGPAAASAISRDGRVIVGMSAFDASSLRHAFRWTEAGGMEDLGTIGGAAGSSIAHAANLDGSVVVGSSDIGAGNRAFVWTRPTGMEDLGAVLAAGGVDMTGVTLQTARGVSDNGQFVTGAGVFESEGGGTRAYVARLGGASGGGGVATPEAVQRSIQSLADSRTAQMATQMLTGSVNLGVNEQVSCAPRCGGAYVSFGSFTASAHGRYNLTPEVTVLAGISSGHTDEPGIEVEATTSLSAAVRFDPDDRGASRPYVEIGGTIAPDQEITTRRVYQNGGGTAVGVGETETDFAQVYARAGWVDRLTPKSEVGASVTISQSWQHTDAYAEIADAENPFPAAYPSVTDRATVVSVAGQYTRLVGQRLEVSANLSANAIVARNDGLVANVAGFDQVTSEGGDAAWLQPGVRAGWRVSPNIVVEAFANATLGTNGVDDGVHGGFGVTARF